MITSTVTVQYFEQISFKKLRTIFKKIFKHVLNIFIEKIRKFRQIGPKVSSVDN